MGIPKELQEIKQWSYSYGSDDLKRPKHSHYTPNGSLAFSQAVVMAKNNKLSFGFYTTIMDAYVIGDLDHMDDPKDPSTLHPAIADILVNKEVYSEISPSGTGVRFVCKLPIATDKEELRGKVFYTRFPLKDKREAQINLGPPWLRFTGNETPYSSGSIPTLSLADLDEAFAIKYKADDQIADAVGIESTSEFQNPVQSDERLPTLQETLAALSSIPLDQNPRIVRSYQKVFSQAYSHYDFWLRTIMGVHDYATKTGTKMECLQAVIAWSRTDADSYKDDEDIITKWQSLSSKEENVSFHTVFALAHSNLLIWPRKKPLTKQQEANGAPSQPLNTEFANFRALVDYYDLQLHYDAHAPGKMYLSGDADIMAQYFEARRTVYYYEEFRGIYDEKTLTSATHIMAQDKGFIGLSHPQTIQHIRDWMFQIRNEIDLVRRYFDTPFEELPESYQTNREYYGSSTVENMFSTLTIDYLTPDTKREERLYFKYYKSWLMGMVRNLYWPHDPHMNNCVLLLTGKEQIRKTSHFRYMLPDFMRDDRIAFTTHGFSTEASMRDLIKLASGNSLLVWDEIEQYLTADTESNFKKLIDSNPTKFIDKYETIDHTYKPVAMFGATSNQKEFKLSDTGSRRLFHIPVTWVDTDKLNNIFWWRIVNDLKKEIENWKEKEPPWLLTPSELEYQATLHGKITAKSGLEIIIREIWNFNASCFLPTTNLTLDLEGSPLKDPRFLSTKGVIDRISMHTNGKVSLPRAQLVRILHNLCGVWTETKNTTRTFLKPRITVFRGLATYGGHHKLWVLPMPLNPYEDQ